MEYQKKRKHARYPLELPVSVSASGGSRGWAAYESSTRDVSVGGLFLYTAVPHAVGEEIDLALVIALRNAALSRLSGKGRVELKGSVIRTEPAGVAVVLDEDYRMRHVDDLELQSGGAY